MKRSMSPRAVDEETLSSQAWAATTTPEWNFTHLAWRAESRSRSFTGSFPLLQISGVGTFLFRRQTAVTSRQKKLAEKWQSTIHVAHGTIANMSTLVHHHNPVIFNRQLIPRETRGLTIGTNVTQWKSTDFTRQTPKKKMKKKKRSNNLGNFYHPTKMTKFLPHKRNTINLRVKLQEKSYNFKIQDL